MKRHLPLTAILILAFATLCLAQEPQASPSPAAKPKPRVSKAMLLKQLSANENKLWEGWKNKDGKPFRAWLAADSIMVGDMGTASKTEAIKEITTMSCDIKSFTLSDWKIAIINSDAALLTYKGSADGTCAGKPIPTTWSSTVWVKRGGRWLAFAHQETDATTGQ